MAFCCGGGGSGKLVSEQVQDELSAVRSRTVFEKIDTLPGSQRESAIHDGNRELHLCERGFQVGRHVVRAFGIVLVGSVLRREAVEVRGDVEAHRGIGILLNEKRCRGVSAKQRQERGVHCLLAYPLCDGRCAFIQTFAPGGDLQGMCRLSQFHLRAYLRCYRTQDRQGRVGARAGEEPEPVSRFSGER